MTEATYLEEFDMVVNELTDQYVAGEFAGPERQRLEQYFLKADERRAKVKFATALKRRTEELAAPSTRKRSLFFYLVPIAAAVLLSSGFGIWWTFLRETAVDKGLTALNSAYRAQRPLESRISNLKYLPFSGTRGPSAANIDEEELRRAELTLLTALKEKPTAATHHALGKVYLAKYQFAEAVAQFEAAIDGGLRKPQVYSDLGAAWLEKGKIDIAGTEQDKNLASGTGIEELARSLDNLSKALEVDPNLLEALFNRALCHTYMAMPQQARLDWQEYLNRDSTSPWAVEARQNFDRLQVQSKSGDQTKEQLLQGFVAAEQKQDNEQAWKILSASRDDLANTNISLQLRVSILKSINASERDRYLKVFRYLAKLETDRAADYYNQNLAVFYSSLTPQERTLLSNAHEALAAGFDDYRNSNFGEAISVFNEARQIFDKAGDQAESIFAEYWIGYCHSEAAQAQAALSILEPLSAKCRERRLNWLLMRVLSALAGTEFLLNEYSKAIRYAAESLALAERIGDQNGTLNALDALVEFDRSINNRRESFRYIERSLPVINCCFFNAVKLWRHYAIVASAFNSAELYRAAIDYQREAVGRAMTVGEISMVCVSHANLGTMLGKLGRYEEGAEEISRAHAKAAERRNDRAGQEMLAYTALKLGQLYQEAENFQAALSSYDESIGLYNELKSPVLLFEAHKGRFICLQTLQQDLLAKVELETALKLAEQYRSTIHESNNRNSFFAEQQTVYDLAANFAYSRLNQSEQAFNYIESSRARSLWDSMNANPAVIKDGAELKLRFDEVFKPLTLPQIKQELSPQVQLIEYAELPDKLMLFVVNRESSGLEVVQISQHNLDQLIERFLKSISSPPSGGTTEVEVLAKQLYEILLQPVESRLHKDRQLVVIPDRALNLIPFGTLLSPKSNRFLIEDFCLSWAPSSTIFLQATRNASARSGTSEKFLGIGNPVFDRNAVPLLSDLPDGVREVQEIAAYYASSQVLIGKETVKQTIERQMRYAEVVHFASHAIIESGAGMKSELVLSRPRDESSNDADEQVLRAYEIYGLKFPNLKLVVLASCQTGTGPNYAGEGTISLARPFLVTGVPLVVASLWPVDSSATRVLLIDFHKWRKQRHVSSAEALRQAQLDMLNGSNVNMRSPYYWAAFFPLGGYTSF